MHTSHKLVSQLVRKSVVCAWVTTWSAISSTPPETLTNLGIVFFISVTILYMNLVANIHLVTTIYVYMHMLSVGIVERCGALYPMAYSDDSAIS